MRSNWQIKKLNEVCSFQNGFAFKSKLFKEKGFPVLRISNIQNDIISYDRLVFFDKASYEEDFNKYQVKKGDLVIAMSGATTGKIAINNTNEVFYLNQRVGRFKPKKELLKEYLFYLLSTRVEENLQISSGSAQPNLSTEQIKNFEIPLPPLFEQQRIVKILDEVFEKIAKAKENTEKNLQNAKDLFETYLRSIFVNLHKSWESRKLGDVCSMINRGVSPKYIESNGTCVLNQKCIRDHKINFDLSRLHDLKNKKVSEDKFIQIGDVLVNSTGTGTLGRVAQVRHLNIEATVDSHITIVRPIKDMFYNDFFGYALIYIEKEIAKRGDGCGGQTELARNTLKNDFKISYPKSLAEQKSIVARLDALSAQTKKLEEIYMKKLENLEELKKSILKKAFDGEL